MIELPVNSFHKVDVIILKDDMPYELASPPTFTIKNADTGAVVRSGTATDVIDDDGHYQIELTASDTSYDRVLSVEWTYVLNGLTVNEKETVFVSTPYATVAEIVDELGLGVDPSDLNYFPYSKIRSAERLARMIIDVHTGHNFGKRQGTITLNGSNKSVMTLPERMISISSVVQNNQLRYDVETNFNNFGYGFALTNTNMAVQVVNTTGEDIVYYPSAGVVNPPVGIFPASSQFQITGIIGYPYVPVEVTQAAVLLINDYLYNDGLWQSRYIDRIDTGEMQIRLRDAAFRGTGNLLADNLLYKYKNVNIVAI